MDRGRNSKAYKADLQAMEEAHERARAQYQPPPPGTASSTDTEEPRPKPPPEYMQHYTQFIPHEPMPIPNAVPKERLPVMRDDGVLFMTGSCAPRTEKEIEEMEKRDKKERELDETFRRLKQGALKHAALNPATSSTQTSTSDAARTGNTTDSDEEEEYPPYHRHVMKEFAHQYGHTTASLAYEEGLKVGAEKARRAQEKEKEKEKKKEKKDFAHENDDHKTRVHQNENRDGKERPHLFRESDSPGTWCTGPITSSTRM
ncbi:hypothetical protein EV127DRAFT_484913 [Xylaria flabelliformis]|nr:hypothetical protein EV127DRAFT_484913 [Xylaria flabelliformis]